MLLSVPELAEDDLEELVANLWDGAGRHLPNLKGNGVGVLLEDGLGELQGLWPGRWTLDLHHPDGRSWSANFTARAGETTEIELR